MEYAFEGFRLDTARKMLWRGQIFVPLGERAYVILCALIERPGGIVSKKELFDRAWPEASVDAANLRVQIANLRKALGQTGAAIVTEQSLGYSFQSEVRPLDRYDPIAVVKRFSVPLTQSKPIGRELDVYSVSRALDQHRLVSIVGPGGIGKTTLALEVAAQADEAFADGVCFVDLSQATDPASVATSVAAALERPVIKNPLVDVGVYLRTRQILIVLDCCERSIEASAELADTVLSSAPGVRILATSREAMRITGERIERLGGLSLPSTDAVRPETASDFGAIALFSRIAQEKGVMFETTERNVSIVSNICRRLDGIPLAIELAAGLTGAFGLEQIRDELAERLSSPAVGRQGGLARHQTLDAAIAWSYETLGCSEALALRRLSVFAGKFSLEEGLQVIVHEGLDRPVAEQSIVSLTQKSMLHLIRSDQMSKYRLLETTRHFAATRIRSLAERSRTQDNHARYILRRLTEIDWEKQNFVQDRGTALVLVADVREAIAWAYESDDPLLPIRLTVAAERLWLELGLYSEHGTRMGEARTWLDRVGIESEGSADLLAAVLSGIAYGVLYEPSDDDRITIVLEALRRSKDIGDIQLYIRNLAYAYNYYSIRHNGYQALDIAEQLREEARAIGDAEIVWFATVASAVSRTQIGDWSLARSYLEEYLNRENMDVSRKTTIYLGYNTTVFALFALAIIEGSEGRPTLCFERIDEALALTRDHHLPQARFQLLYFAACRMALRCGDVLRARVYLDLLEHQARDYAPWQFLILVYQGWMAYSEGKIDDAQRLLEQFMSRGSPLASLQVTIHLLLADVLRSAGDLVGAEQAALQAFNARTGDQDPFAVGPSMRAKADILIARNLRQNESEAAELYSQAIENARRHNALTAEIPATLGLARLQISRGQYIPAIALLQSVVDRVVDGTDLPPMVEVRNLLAKVASQSNPLPKDAASTRARS